MMLTMTPRNAIAARTADKGRAASGVVLRVAGIVGNVVVVILGDSSRPSAGIYGISRKAAERTQTDARGNNKTDHYGTDATDTGKPHDGVFHRLQGDGRCCYIPSGQC